jgi:fatty acid desaturase
VLAVLLPLFCFYWLVAFGFWLLPFGFCLLAIRKKEKDWENREKLTTVNTSVASTQAKFLYYNPYQLSIHM